MLSDFHKKTYSSMLGRLKKKMAQMEMDESPSEESAEAPAKQLMESRLGLEGDVVKPDDNTPYGDESVNGSDNVADGMDSSSTAEEMLDKKQVSKLEKDDYRLDKRPRGIVKIAMAHKSMRRSPGRPKKMG